MKVVRGELILCFQTPPIQPVITLFHNLEAYSGKFILIAFLKRVYTRRLPQKAPNSEYYLIISTSPVHHSTIPVSPLIPKKLPHDLNNPSSPLDDSRVSYHSQEATSGRVSSSWDIKFGRVTSLGNKSITIPYCHIDIHITFITTYHNHIIQPLGGVHKSSFYPQETTVFLVYFIDF